MFRREIPGLELNEKRDTYVRCKLYDEMLIIPTVHYIFKKGKKGRDTLVVPHTGLVEVRAQCVRTIEYLTLPT